jgi:peptidoglycan-associated lipoprotein
MQEEGMKKRFISAFGLGLLALSLTGCPPKAQIKKEEPKTTDESQKNQPAEEPSLRGKEYKDVPELGAIFFDLDQSSLKNDARETLRKNYQALKEHSDWEVLVEGHTDERGTTEYNLGLGQRRAATVRQYYISLGIEGTRIATLSYGKEKPICEEHNDECWGKNRRAVTKARVPAKTAE